MDQPLNLAERSNNRNPNQDSLVESLHSYLCHRMLVIELIACIAIAALGHIAPSSIFRISLYEREIPYLISNNGEIIIDQYINRPKVENETVSDVALVAIAILLPSVLTLFIGYFSTYRIYEMHSSFCGVCFAFGSCMFLTNVIKLYCGYFRPNFYNLCQFDSDALECQGEDRDVSESRRSFPSGHASTSFCGMTFITLVLLGKVGLHCRYDKNGEKIRNLSTIQIIKRRWLSVLVSTPMLIAVFVAVSRVHDDMHHPADVAFGAMIGMLSAYFAYGLWYSDLYSDYAGFSLMAQMIVSFRISDSQSSQRSESQPM